MAEQSVLSDEFLRQLMYVGAVDLMVAVPTHNDAKTIAQVVEAVRIGLVQHFPRERAVLVNTDAGSRDGTVQHLLQAANAPLPAEASQRALRTFHVANTGYGDGRPSVSALPLLLAAADLLQAKVCAVVSPSPNVAPEWIGRLLSPICRESFAFASPLYSRHKFEGLLVKLLLYPMMRAIYGKRIREPYATEFAFSGRFGSELIAIEESWPGEPGGRGEALRLSASAVAHGYPVCEVFLGDKEHAERSSDLVPALQETVGTLFTSLEVNRERWRQVHGSESVPVKGGNPEVTSEPLRVNRKRLYQMFHSGIADLQPVLITILTPKTFGELCACAASREQEFRFSDELWVRTVYEFAASYHRAVISRDHILQALVPVYRGKVYEFLTDYRHAGAGEIEARLEALCLAFERLKPYLLQSWDGKQGGSYEGNDPSRTEPDMERAGEGIRAPHTADRGDADRNRRGVAHRVRGDGGGAQHPAYQPL